MRSEMFIETSSLNDVERMFGGGFDINTQINNDPILKSKGGDLISLYAPLLQDGQVLSNLQQRISGCFVNPMVVTPASDRAEDEKIAEEVKTLLERDDIQKSCQQILLSGLFYGFVPAEILWEPDGRQFAIKELKVRKPHRFAFSADGQLRLKREGESQTTELLQEKFIIFRAGNIDSDSPYGRGLAYQLFWPVNFKRLAAKWWARLGESVAVPTGVVKYPTGANEEQKQMAAEAIRAVINNSRIAIPEGMTVEFLETKAKGEPLENQLNYYNSVISKIILSQTMTTDDGSSKSQAQVHKDVADAICRGDSNLLDSVLQKQLVNRYVAYNWPSSPPPKVFRDWSEEEDRNKLAAHDRILHGMGIVVRDDRIQKRYGADFEKKAPDDPIAEKVDDAEQKAHQRNFAETWQRRTTLPLVDSLTRLQEYLDGSMGFEDFEARMRFLYADQSNDPALLQALERAILNAFVAGSAGVDNIHELMIDVGEQFTDGDGVDFFGLPDKQAAEYLRNKGYRYSLRHTDWYGKAHARAFTVAKMIDLDLLSETREALLQAIEQGTTFAEFKDGLIPKMQKRGWWGRRPVINPETGEVVTAQLGSNARLETIFRTNIASAHAASQWRRIRETKHDFPYLQYQTVGDSRVRDEHAAWDDIVLPVGDRFWRTHFPPNGYRCRCWVRQISQARIKAEGLKVSKRPAMPTRKVTDKVTGEVRRVPEGITAGFEHNAGMAERTAPAIADLPAKIYQDPKEHDVDWWNSFGAGLPEGLASKSTRPSKLGRANDTPEAWQNWLDAAHLSPKAREISLTDALGVKVVLTERLVAHLRGEDLPEGDKGREKKQKDNRDQDYRAIVETIQNPDEIWLAPFGKKQNRLRQRYLKSYQQLGQIFVLERDASGHIAVTGFGMSLKQLNALRKGYPVYRLK